MYSYIKWPLNPRKSKKEIMAVIFFTPFYRMPSNSTIKRMQNSFTVRGNTGLYNHTRNMQAGLLNSLKKKTNRWRKNMNRLTRGHKKTTTKKTRRVRK